MVDRSMHQLDVALAMMNAVDALPERANGESFRSYFARVAPIWIESNGAGQADLVERVQRLLEREARRHPKLGAKP